MKRILKMKDSAFNFQRILLLVFVISTQMLSAQTYELGRKIVKTYKLENIATEVQVINKYGNIMVIPWNRDSVRFEINITVKGGDEGKIDKAFNMIDFSFRNTPFYVVAQSNLSKEGSFWTDIVDIAQTVFDSKVNTSVDYKVYMPVRNPVILENKFGDIYFSDHHGKVNVRLSNGAFKAHAFTGEAILKINFGKASIHSVDEATVDITYSSMRLEHADNLNLTSRSSEFRLNNIEKLKIQSKRDDYFVKNVGSLTGKSYFTDYEIVNLEDYMSMETNYGACDLSLSSAALSRVNMISSYSDYTLRVDESLKLDVELTFNSSTELFLPEQVMDAPQETLDEEEEIYKTSFRLGRSGSAVPVIFNGKGGNLRIEIK